MEEKTLKYVKASRSMSIHTQDFPFWHTLTPNKKTMCLTCAFIWSRKQSGNGFTFFTVVATSSAIPVILKWKKTNMFALSAVDLLGCLQPALIHLFAISPAASAGPQPAWEWKCLAHVIFGKCRVHRNPGAWSPVSARRPRLTIRLQSKDGGNMLQISDGN